MRRLGLLVVLAAAALAAGCWTLSVNPLYFETDLILEPSLIGLWQNSEADEGETWTFEIEEDKTYRLATKESGGPDGVFLAHLLRLGGQLCMDLYPDGMDSANEFQRGHYIPAHSIWWVTLNGNDLTLDCIDTEWLEAKIDSGLVEIDNIRPEDVIVLTASTEDLQAFVLKHLDEALSGDPIELKRVR